VPSKAVKMRKMKKAAKLGASAVPMLHPRKRTAVVQVIYTCATKRGQPPQCPFLGRPSPSTATTHARKHRPTLDAKKRNSL
jgi:hypothetical protein